MSIGEPTVQPILLLANLSGFLVVGTGVDAPVEPVVVEHIQAALNAIQLSLVAPQSLLAGGTLAHVAGNQFFPQPMQNRVRNHEFAETFCELAFQNLLAGIRPRAFAAVPGTMIQSF